MILAAELFLSGRGAGVEHVLEPVDAVGDLEADPIVVGGVAAAVPVGAEAEEVFEEGVFFGGVADDEADVDDAGAGGVGRGRGVGCGGGCGAAGASLDEDDVVAFGVEDGEGASLEGLVDGNAARLEVALEAGGVAGGEADGGEAVESVGWLGVGEKLDPLKVVDGVEPVAGDFGAGEAEGVGVEVLRGWGVGGVEADEGDAGDGGAHGLRWRLRDEGCGGEQEREENAASHVGFTVEERAESGQKVDGDRWVVVSSNAVMKTVDMKRDVDDGFSHFHLAEMAKGDAYKLLASVILPRPIAWVVSRDADGVVNAAPFSFFNIVSSDPPLVAISFSNAADREEKDTLSNIATRGEFVVNMVPEELAEAMNVTATNAPRGVDETQLAGLEMAPSTVVDVPRIAGSPVAMECRVFETITPGGASTILLGRIVFVHVRTEAFADLERLYIDPAKLRLIGRMHGAGGYTRTRDVFEIQRKNWPLK